MHFTDPAFLFSFLPVALIVHRAALAAGGNRGYGNAPRFALFALTLVFYGWTTPWWLIPFLVSIVFDFIWATWLSRTTDARVRRLVLGLSIVQNLSLLGAFKYWDFIRANVVFMSSAVAPWPPLTADAASISLPPAISFYTFESLSFVIDVYRRDVRAPQQPLDFFAFIGMFPRFIAGPIVRYRQLATQLANYNGMQIESGLVLFALGLFTKTCFADQFAVFVPYAFGHQQAVGFVAAWTGVLAYAFQIYFDFSGYSLMAIGLGRCLGFQFPTNFNRPYLADGLQDFWRRWHITLSLWLRDYLYLPLGGSRHGRVRTYVNLMLTMLIGGFWHGASWNYVMWGGWHGLWLSYERALGSTVRMPLVLRRVATFAIVVVGWVFFRATSLAEAQRIIKAMGTIEPGLGTFASDALVTNPVATAFCALGLVYCFVIEPRVPAVAVEEMPAYALHYRAAAVGLTVCALLVVFSAREIPFLYFQF